MSTKKFSEPGARDGARNDSEREKAIPGVGVVYGAQFA
jgi:hypothetical protein